MIPAFFGLAGPAVTDAEADFFRDCAPAGFILFARNIDTPQRLAALTDQLRSIVGWRCPILIDQEGGRVQRMRPPHWRPFPPAALSGDIWANDRVQADRGAYLHARLIADDLIQVGIDVNCLPLLDVPVSGADAIIGDRVAGHSPDQIAHFGAIFLRGLQDGGVQGVIKHIPGHGRATADSHLALPVVDASDADLRAQDIPPFKALASAPYAMTAHVAYTAWDGERPATLSASIIRDIIRGEIGFSGLLMTDDLSMKALGGAMEDRVKAALAAGCDLMLHCNGDMAEMQAVAAAVGSAGLANDTLQAAIAAASLDAQPLSRTERAELQQEFDGLTAPYWKADHG